MKKKYSNHIIVAIAGLILVFALGMNVMAAHEGEIPFKTDMSNRTMLKEIIVNQQKTHTLLSEIKGLLQK